MKKFSTYLVILSFVITMSTLSTNKAYAVAQCITDWSVPGDPICGTIANISAPGGASGGSSIGVSFSSIGTFETYNDVHLFHGWVTGALNYDIINNTFSRSWSGSVGPLPGTVTLSLCVQDHQQASTGDMTCSSQSVNVTVAPPTVDIHFSFFDQVNKFFMVMIAAGEKTNTLAVADTMSAESR